MVKGFALICLFTPMAHAIGVISQIQTYSSLIMMLKENSNTVLLSTNTKKTFYDKIRKLVKSDVD